MVFAIAESSEIEELIFICGEIISGAGGRRRQCGAIGCLSE